MTDFMRRYRLRPLNVAAAPPPGGESLITVVTTTSRSASTETNQMVEFGLPMDSGWLGSSQNIKVYDDDGSGGQGAAIAYQWDGESKDGVDAPGAKRLGIVSCVVPSYSANQTRKLRVVASSDALPTGTGVTLADIQALGGYANGLYEAAITEADTGTTYTISAKDIIDGGTTTFGKTALWRCSQNWRSGPYVTEWRLRAAPRNGGSPHSSGDGIHVEFHLSAYKAQAGAVSGGNPITLITCCVEFENADAERLSGDVKTWHYQAEIRRATSLSDPTMIITDQDHPIYGTQRAAYPSITVSGAGITLSASSVGTSRTIDLTSGSWPSLVIGARIMNASGNGKAVVTARTSNTRVTVTIYEAFTATSYADGAWRTAGIEHWYGSPWHKWFSIGAVQRVVPAWGNLTSAITSNSRGVLDYLVSTKLAPNYQYAHTASHDTAELDLLLDSGDMRPFCSRHTVGQSATWGGIKIDIPGTGGSPAIGYHAEWDLRGLCGYNDAGRRLIFQSHDVWSTYQNMPPRLSRTPVNGALAALPARTDQGDGTAANDYKWHPGHTGILIQTPATSYRVWTGDGAHNGMGPFVPYLLTGHYSWFKGCQASAENYAHWGTNNSTQGAGINRTPLGDPTGARTAVPFGGQNGRVQAIGIREATIATIVTPDAAKDQLYNAKDYQRTRMAKTFAAGKRYGPDDALNTYSTPFDAPWMNGSAFDSGYGGRTIDYEANWMVSFIVRNLCAAAEMGITSADWPALRDWLAALYVARRTATGSVADYYTDSGLDPISAPGHLSGNTKVDVTAAQRYQRAALVAPASPTSIQSFFSRTITGTITLSDATVGTGRTITFSNAYFANGGTGSSAWYVGGYVVNGNVNGVAKITSITSSTVVVADIEVAFPSTTPAASGIYIPGPHPSDYANEALTIRQGSYALAFTVAARMLKDQGVAGAADTVSYMTGRPNYSDFAIAHWNIAART